MPEFFNGYYDTKNYVDFANEELKNIELSTNLNLSDFYNEEKIMQVKKWNDLKTEIDTLIELENPKVNIKSFDYDGVKYTRKEIKHLKANLSKTLDDLGKQILLNDQSIAKYVNTKLINNHDFESLQVMLKNYKTATANHENNMAMYDSIVKKSDFISQQTNNNVIYINFADIKIDEYKIKSAIKLLLNEPIIKTEVSVSIVATLEKYVTYDLNYFDGDQYDTDNLNILFSSLNYVVYISGLVLHQSKKDYLNNLVKVNEN